MEAHPQYGEEMRISDQLIRFDRSCTEQAYAGIDAPAAEECGCAMCMNFVAQRSTAFPDSFIGLLHQLGVDPSKEGEVYYLGPSNGHKRLYGGWFFLCGELLKTGEKEASRDGISYHVIGPGNMPSPYPPDRFGPQPLALDFHFEIPWVLPNGDPEISQLTRPS